MRTTYTETFTRVERVVDAVRGLCKEHGFGFGKMGAESLRNSATNDPEALPIWVVTSEPEVIVEDWEPTENGDWGVERYTYYGSISVEVVVPASQPGKYVCWSIGGGFSYDESAVPGHMTPPPTAYVRDRAGD